MQAPRDRDLREVELGHPAVRVVEEELDLAVLGGRAAREPAKRTSSGFSARSSVGARLPAAQRIASATFDLPEPFGPTTTATPGSRRTSTGSGNDLKPRSLIDCRCTRRGSYGGGARTGRRSLPASRRARGASSASRAASCSASFFVRPLPTPSLLAVDHRRAGEPPVVRRAVDLEHGVATVRAGARERLLQLRLVVDVLRGRVLDPARRTRRRSPCSIGSKPCSRKSARERRLEQRREHVAVAREARELVVREPTPRSASFVAELELPGDRGAALARDDVRADLRQPALGEVGEAVVERAGDRQLEDAVAEELQPLVRRPCGPAPTRSG